MPKLPGKQAASSFVSVILGCPSRAGSARRPGRRRVRSPLMAVNRVAAFLDSLRASQLLPPDAVEQVGQSPHARGDDPTPLARELVRAGHLTAYQAKQLAKGGKDL